MADAGYVAAELETRRRFERLFALERDSLPEIDRFLEPDPVARHLLFLLHLPEGTWLGRKLIDGPRDGRAMMTSRITPEMLLGRWASSHLSQDGLRCLYRPAPAADKRAALARALSSREARLDFPYALLDAQGRELTCPPGYWSGDPALADVLDRGEAHLRAHTARVVPTLDLPDGAVAFDPACSTGKFLEAVGRAAPQLRIVGSDLSAEMVERARTRIHEAFVADAGDVRVPAGCRLLVLRFLSSEVTTSAAAEAAFEGLCRQLDPGAYVIVIGHNPVLVQVDLLGARLGFERLAALGGVPGEELFEYHLLRRKRRPGP